MVQKYQINDLLAFCAIYEAQTADNAKNVWDMILMTNFMNYATNDFIVVTR